AQVRSVLREEVCEFNSSQLRHDDISYQEVDSALVIAGDLERTVAVLSLNDGKSSCGKCADREFAHRGVVFDDEGSKARRNGMHCNLRPVCGPFAQVCGNPRQEDTKATSPAGLRLHGNMTRALFDDSVNGCESQSRTATDILCRKERIEGLSL